MRTAENVEMQGIEFQIVNDSEAAAQGIERLGKALSGLKTDVKDGVSAISRAGRGIAKLREALDGIDTAGIGQKLKSLSSAINSLNIDHSAKISASLPKNIAALNTAVANIQPEKITQLGNALQAVADSSGAKVSAALPKNIEALNTALSGLDGNNVSKLNTLAAGLQPLSTLEPAHLTSYINQLSKLPEVIRELDGLDIGKFADEMERLAKAVRPFADEMNKVAAGFSAFPSRIQRLITSTELYNRTVGTATRQTNLFSKALSFFSFATLYRTAYRLIGQSVNSASEYVEMLNMFNVSMGEYAEEAKNYADKVSDALGIDPAEWMQNQGVFNSIIKGFGVAGDKAAFMSKNLTQLSYDLSSFYNISTQEAFQKVQSGISGELEPLRRLGYDLSVAKLQEEALALGITKKVSAMNQAEKAQLRYYTMMKQVTVAQGDMARTLDEPANQLRVLKAQLTQCAVAWGQLFLPVLTKTLPYLIAFAQVLAKIGSIFAKLFGYTMKETKGAASDVVESTGEVSDNIEEATGKAKKLQKILLGIDELNVLPDKTDTSSSGTGIDGSSFDIPLGGYDFLKDSVQSQADGIAQKMLEWLGLTKEINSWTDLLQTRFGKILLIVGAIGVALAAWKISKALSGLFGVGKGTGETGGALTVGQSTLAMRMQELAKAFAWGVAIIAEVCAAALLVTGSIALLGLALKQVGTAWQPVIDNAKEVATAVLLGVTLLADVGFACYQLGRIGGTAAKNIAIGAAILVEIGVAAGLLVGEVLLLGLALEKTVEAWEPLTNNAAKSIAVISSGIALLGLIGAAAGGLGLATTATGTLIPAAFAIGTLVMGEIAIATLAFVAETWAVGKALQTLVDSWQPVIDNGSTVMIAVASGISLLIGIGGIVGVLGLATVLTGALIPEAFAAGTLVMAQMAVAVLAFTAETYVMGLALQKVAEAWGPVVSEGKTVAEAIFSGLGMLVLIGGAAAGLGLASIASAGTIPAAIGIGTAVMLEITVAVVAFTASITVVANQLSGSLAPALANVNAVLPGLSSNMSNFTAFMGQFATQVAQYSASTAVSGLSSIVDRVVNLFAGNPIERFANSVEENGRQASNLTMKLSIAIPELQTACQMLESYEALVQKLNELLNVDISFTDSTQLNMQEIGMNIVTGLAQGMVNGQPMLIAATTSTLELLNTGFVLPTQELFTNFFLTLDTSVMTSTQNINTSFLMSAETINNGFIVTLNAAFLAFFTTQTTQFMNLQTTILTVFQQSYMAAVSGFISPVTAQTITMVSQLRALMEQLRAAIVSSFQQAAAGVQSAFSILPGWFSGAVYSPIISMINSMLAEMRAAIAEANAAVSSIQSRTWSARSTTLRYRNYGGYSFPTFATGGFPDTGNVFIANEAGPEMVGTIGNRTAVANNDQIVEAVAAGVYRAVVQANSAQQGGGNRIEVYLSGKQIMTSVAEEARRETLRTGVNPLTQGG